MNANAAKFQVAFFSRDNEGITINLEGIQLHSNECTKLLGMNVDRYLTLIIMYQNYVEKLLDK